MTRQCMARHAWHVMARHATALHGKAWHVMTWHGTAELNVGGPHTYTGLIAALEHKYHTFSEI